MSVAVYSLYMSTLGGGERSTIEFSRTLRDLTGEEVVIYSLASSVTVRGFLEKSFGVELEDIQFSTSSSPEEVKRKLFAADHSLFLNHTHHSRMPNPFSVGLYAMMFPPRDGDRDFLRSYDHLFCNSQFTANYTALYYPSIADRVQVLYPPIAFRQCASNLADKDWQLAINIGRYSFTGHCKRQFEVATAVKRANTHLKNPLRLRCFGRVTEKSYFDKCSSLTDSNIEFYANATEEALAMHLACAGLYVHGCGLGLARAAAPELCEHLGLAIIEAMHAGCVPLVVSRGGANEFVQHGVNGFLYESPAELTAILRTIATLPAQVKQRMARAAMAAVEPFTPHSFARRMRQFILPPPDHRKPRSDQGGNV